MAKYKSIVTTEAGLALLENAAYMGSAIQFTALKTGNGTYDGTEDLAVVTDLKNVCQTFGVGSVTKKDSDILIRTVINNMDVVESYTITEVGLYANDPAIGTEILYAIIVAETGSEDYFPPYTEAPSSITIEMVIGITESAEAATFNVIPFEGAYVPVESFNEVLDGTVPVGDSLKFGGETAEEWQGKIDSIQSKSSESFATAGWYRVAEYSTDSSGYETNCCEFVLTRNYDTADLNEFHHLRLLSFANNTATIESLGSKSGVQTIKKVRFTKDSVNKKSYLEVYYDYSTYNVVKCILAPLSYHGSSTWKAITPTLTEETVDGVTVTTTYNITANASPATDRDVAKAASHSAKNLSAAGWYRVAKLKCDSFGITGAYSSACRLRIKKTASNGPGDYAEIHFLLTGHTYNFICTESQAADGSMCCSKIRYTHDGTNTGYLEVYYSENNANGVYFTVEGGVGGYYWEAMTPEATSETVDGITVAKTYDIKPNVTPLNTGNMPKGTYTGNGASRVLYIYAQSSTYMVRAKGSADFAIVCPSGYIAKQGNSVVCGAYPCESNGTIQMTSNYTSALFNASGTTYEYLAL